MTIQDGFFRFHVTILGRRTTISMDADLFEALSFKLGSGHHAKHYIREVVKHLEKANTNGKSISRSIQSYASRIIAGIPTDVPFTLPESGDATEGGIVPLQVATPSTKRPATGKVRITDDGQSLLGGQGS